MPYQKVQNKKLDWNTAPRKLDYRSHGSGDGSHGSDGWNDWNGSYDDWGSPGTQQGPDEAYNAEDDDDESYDSNDPDLDEDEVAYTDDAGYFYATEEVCDHVDCQLSTEVPEYAQAATNYTTARALMAKARVARGFYPVVVPATDAGSPPQRKGKGKGKRRSGKGKGRGGKKDKGSKGSSKGSKGSPL